MVQTRVQKRKVRIYVASKMAYEVNFRRLKFKEIKIKEEKPQ